MTALLLVCGITFAEGSVFGVTVARDQWILVSMPYTDSSGKVVQEGFFLEIPPRRAGQFNCL